MDEEKNPLDNFIDPKDPRFSPKEGETVSYDDLIQNLKERGKADQEGNTNLDTDIPQEDLSTNNSDKKDTGILDEEKLNNELQERINKGEDFADIFPDNEEDDKGK